MYKKLKIGDNYKEVWKPNHSDLGSFAELSGDFNSIHNDLEFSLSKGFSGLLVHGNLTCAKLSGIIGMSFPGEGTLIIEQNLAFPNPIYLDENINFELKVDSVNNDLEIIVLKVKATKNSNKNTSLKSVVLRGKIICKML